MDTKDSIVLLAESCERELGLELGYLSAGMFEEAAICADSAESLSFLAFRLARDL